MPEELNESMQFYLEVLKEEYVVYKELFEKAVKERKAVQEMDMQKLHIILSEKEILLSRIARMDERIKNLRDVWKEARDIIRPELSQEIHSFLVEFSDFMKGFVAYEAETEKMFISKNGEKQKELATVRNAKRANKAYFRDQQKLPPNTTNIIR